MPYARPVPSSAPSHVPKSKEEKKNHLSIHSTYITKTYNEELGGTLPVEIRSQPLEDAPQFRRNLLVLLLAGVVFVFRGLQ